MLLCMTRALNWTAEGKIFVHRTKCIATIAAGVLGIFMFGCKWLQVYQEGVYMRTIVKDGVVLARHIKAIDLGQGLNFFSDGSETIQVGTWWYDAGKVLSPHIHNYIERKVGRTCEVLYLISGALEVTLYTLEEEFVETIVGEAGDILVMLGCGHGYRILDDKTRVLEVKNGPYPGNDIDRYRF